MRIRSFTLTAVLTLIFTASHLPAQQNTYLKAKVSPGRAGVFIDGKYLGPAANFGISRKYAVAPGEHEIRLCEPRYEEFVTKISVQAGKTTVVSQSLKELPPPKPPFGLLRTQALDKFAAVYVNGRYMGHVDEFSNSMQGLKLNPGAYTVKIVPSSGSGGREEQVRIEENKTVVVRLQ
jgi:hypothetical protein